MSLKSLYISNSINVMKQNDRLFLSLLYPAIQPPPTWLDNRNCITLFHILACEQYGLGMYGGGTDRHQHILCNPRFYHLYEVVTIILIFY